MGSWATQPLTVEATELGLKALGFQNPVAIKWISEVTGYYACLAAASLLSVASYNVFGDLADSTSKQNCQSLSLPQVGINALVVIISGISSVHRVELAIRYTHSTIAKPIVAVCSAVGRIVLNYFSIKKFFNCSGNASTKKEKLINLIEEILVTIDNMNADAINNLEKMLNSQKKAEVDIEKN